MFWSDVVASVAQARALNINVALFPQPRFARSADDFWKSAPRDAGWWDNWFNHYRAFAVNYAAKVRIQATERSNKLKPNM
jgi:hypothetical protein